MRLVLLVSTLVGLSLPGSQALCAGPSGVFLNVGPGALVFDEGATVSAAGSVIPGATVKIHPNETLLTAFGYRWNRVAISFTGGYPPLATVNGAGSLATLGELGRIRYGPMVLTAQYHFTQFGRLQPYVGAGPVFLYIFKNDDGAVRDLKVRDHVGAAIQFGVEYSLGPRWSAYFDAKKVFLKTNATALLNGTPIAADIRLNPIVLGGGLSYRF